MIEFELIDKDENPTGHRSNSVRLLADKAAELWPGQEQNNASEHEERPNGWDVIRVH